MSIELSGPWSLDDVAEFLDLADFPIRLACVGADGFPRVVSVWYRYQEETFTCVTHKDSELAKMLRQDNRVGFEVSPNDPPYHGIRGQGRVELQPLRDEAVLRGLLERYLGGTGSQLGKWLLSRASEELLLTLHPTRMFSWDYRERMADVG